ncbi:sugar ABC transporter ATP-binding protein [Dactylosporangium aurantiacum]|uniref:Sugar ABC transporter ATP-binding protein n=1 Tax=Dactylosporangium aurantiacum TaxID=35754 RepID=A0A9Q9MDH7_9ACTN|nr:sugar ABC transporter ATP-binding protein [Dactylosporangium aurantiacum]MDG6109660.1 sugar ABC transporter ATP-binding protein [Dactylosporangium aurantiacum]UWZ50275.1 sugar ABC transporter ATP-binding protein [Dactylosporangium aurantiacum]
MTDATGASTAPAVEAVHTSKRFGATTALHDVSLAIAPGSTHALVGRNGAGKSTLVSLLTGLQGPDSGAVAFDGRPAPPVSDRAAWRSRVACVFQRSTIIPDLSVAENLFLNRQGDLVRWGALRRRAARLLEEYAVDVDPAARAGDLGVEQRQLVEIARALSQGARFIILDEPTARLDATAIDRLFGRLRALSATGVTMLFISHHLQEVYAVCDTVTVLRDARHVLTAPVADVDHDALVAAMTGEAVGLTAVEPRPPVAAGTPVALRLSGLTLRDSYTSIDVDVRAGEIVGVTGSGSSGKVALAETVGGLRRATAGTVTVAGRPVPPGSVPAALAAGIGLVPQDRHREGLVPLLSVAENATLPIAASFGPLGYVSPGRRTATARAFIDRYDIRTSGPSAPVSSLSGGNAQKVVLARALSASPSVLVLINPTAGVDVRSKESLLGAVRTAAGDGTAVLMVSDELDDLRHCDRVLVMFHGRVVAALPAGWSDTEVVAAVEGVSQ